MQCGILGPVSSRKKHNDNIMADKPWQVAQGLTSCPVPGG